MGDGDGDGDGDEVRLISAATPNEPSRKLQEDGDGDGDEVMDSVQQKPEQRAGNCRKMIGAGGIDEVLDSLQQNQTNEQETAERWRWR
jgi:hypothetical protein